jgi:hypothetical protein
VQIREEEPPMSATMVPGTASVSASIARRALELGRDPGVSLAEGAHHLIRLALGRSFVLERALADVRHEQAPSSDGDHACILLRHAIGELAGPPFSGGSRTELPREVLDATVD